MIGGNEMRGTDRTQSTMFSYVSPEARIPADHPLRATREMANRALVRLDRKFRSLYSRTGDVFALLCCLLWGAAYGDYMIVRIRGDRSNEP